MDSSHIGAAVVDRRSRLAQEAANAIRLAGGLALLVLALYQVDLGAMTAALQSIQRPWLLVTVGTLLLGIGLKAARWNLLLKPVCPEKSRKEVLGALLIGQSANVLLPFRGGDLVRAVAIVPATDGRLGAVLVGIAVEKAFDLFALGMMAALVLPLLPAQAPSVSWIRPIAIAVAVLAGLLTFGLVSPRAWSRVRPLFDGPAGGIRRRAQKWVDRLSAGLADLSRSRSLPGVFGMTLLIWLVMLSTNITLLRALNMDLSPGAAALVLVAVHVGLVPALMPGNVGPFYMAAQIGLMPFVDGLDERLAYAVLLHAIVTIPPLMGAGFYLASGRRRRPHA